jgi:hypothetical protein
MLHDELDVSFGNPKEFWKKTEEERFEYFKNCSMHYFTLLTELEQDEKWKRKARRAKEVFTNIMFFLVFLMTTKEEQVSDIANVWIARFMKDIKTTSDLFIDYNKVGNA